MQVLVFVQRSWPLKKDLKHSELEWTGNWQEKEAAAGRQMKGNPVLAQQFFFLPAAGNFKVAQFSR